jgi:hypothetical protein
VIGYELREPHANMTAGLCKKEPRGRKYSTAGGRDEGARLAARPFQRSQPLMFWPLAYSTRTPPLAAVHGAAMRSLVRFMFIAIATN